MSSNLSPHSKYPGKIENTKSSQNGFFFLAPRLFLMQRAYFTFPEDDYNYKVVVLRVYYKNAK